MIEQELTYQELDLSLKEIYEALGYKDGALPDAGTQREVLAVLTEVETHLVARFAFVTRSITSLDAFAPGRIILSELRGCQAVCWFVATAGQWFEDYQQRLMRDGDMVRVYIANEIGSLLAEKAADRMEQVLERQIAPKGLHRTNRYSPGYCGWAVDEQRRLFAQFQPSATGDAPTTGEDTPLPSPCGIRLTASCLMTPIKSVSGVIGIGKDAKKHDYKCRRCGLASCYKRRENR